MECNSTAPPISPASLYVEQLASRLSAAPLLFSASVSSTYSFRSDPSPRRLSTKLKPRRCCFSPALLLFFGAAALLTSVLDITTHGAVSYGCRPFRFRASHQRGHVPSLFLLLRVALKSSLPVLVFSAAPSVFPSIFPPAPCNFFSPAPKLFLPALALFSTAPAKLQVHGAVSFNTALFKICFSSPRISVRGATVIATSTTSHWRPFFHDNATTPQRR